MNQMIKTIRQSNGNVAVSGRDLHKFLEIKTPFRIWVNRMVSDYGFVNDVDYMVSYKNVRNSRGGRPSKDYIFTLDTAKEICMVQRNSLGRMARQYFINVQKHYQNADLPTNPELRLKQLVNESIQDLNKRTNRNSDEIIGLKHTVDNTMRVTSTEQYQLKNVEHRVVIKQLGGYDSAAYQKYSSRGFQQCWRDFKDHFNLPRYSDLPHGQFDNGLSFLSSWHLHGQLSVNADLVNRQITLGAK